MKTWWNNLSIRVKGLLLMGVPVLCLFSVVAVIGWMLLQVEKLDADTNSWQRLTEQGETLAQDFIAADSALRGYALTNSPDLVPPFEWFLQDIPGHLSSLQATLEGRFSAAEIAELRSLCDQKLELLRGTMLYLQQHPDADPRSEEVAALMWKGKEVMDALEKNLQKYTNGRETYANARAQMIREKRIFARNVTFVALATAVLIIFAGFLAFSSLGRRLRHLEAFAQKVADGDAVELKQTGSDEISGLGNKLQEMATAIRERETRLEDILESITDAFYALDKNWVFTYTNREAERLLITSRDHLLGKVIWEVFPEAVGSKFYQQYHRAMEEQSPLIFDEQVSVEFLDGSEEWLWYEVRVFPSSNGLSVYSRDVTEQRKAEAERIALEAARAKMADRERAIIENALDVICSLHKDGKFVDLSAASSSIWGKEPGELVGHHFSAIVAPEDVAATARAFESAISGSAVRAFENRCVARDGTYMHTSWSAHWSDHNQMLFCVAHDITDRKQAELEIKNARDKALEAMRTKSDFLANVSHEIRTPLNGIIGMTDLTLSTELTPDQREYLTMVKNSGESLLHLVKEILDFAKVDAKKLRLEPQEVSLRQTLDDSVGTLAIKAEMKGLVFNIVTQPDVPRTVVVDPQRLRQVLINLVGNSLKFTDTGKIELLVSKKSGADLLRFEVVDTGIGIASEHLPLLFESFTQLDGSTTRKYGGTGLGLAISKQLVELMGGTVGVQSEPNKGSMFWFEIPFAKPGTAAPSTEISDLRSVAEPTESTPVPEIVSKLPARPLVVLVAEHDPVNRKLAEALVLKRGWEVVSVASWDETRKITAEREFDLILLDVRLLGKDGLDAKEIRSLQRSTDKRTPVLAMTSRSQREEEQRCLRAGMDEVLSKPLRAEEFNRKTEKLCQDTQQEEPERAPSGSDIDFEAISSLLDGDQELMSEVLHEFRRECPAKIEALRTAVSDRHPEEADRASQRLRGPLLYFHCKGAAGDLNVLSNLALSGRWNEVDKRLEHVERAVAGICVEIEGRLGMANHAL